MKNKIIQLTLLATCYLLLATFLTGCATAPLKPPPPPKGSTGIYHQVKKNQTLWRIAKAYQLDLDTIARVNRLADTSKIYEGQLIFIPGAKEKMETLILESDLTDQGGDFIWPVKGKVISFYGMKRQGVQNNGIHIRTKEDASIVAARSGRISFCSEELKGYGRIIIIDHLDGYSSVYAYNAQNLVRLNQLVKQRQIIARAGCAGQTGSPELYFEIRRAQEPRNPFFYLP